MMDLVNVKSITIERTSDGTEMYVSRVASDLWVLEVFGINQIFGGNEEVMGLLVTSYFNNHKVRFKGGIK